MREAEPDADELFALSRERAERFERLPVGCLADYLTFDGEFMIEYAAFNMLNALRTAAGGQTHTAFEIVEHSPTHWTATHRRFGNVIEVRLKSDFENDN